MTQLEYYTAILSHAAMFLALLSLVAGLVGSAVIAYFLYPWFRK